jgi:tetratricopeptide (TPR) repeat protein
LAEARAEYEALAAREAKPVAALTMIGMILQGQSDTAGARQYYERVLELDSGAAVAANNLAWLLATQGGNLDVALQHAQTAKRHLPDNADVSDTLGFIYYKKGLHTLAIAALKESAEKDARNPVFQSHLGLAYAKAGDAARAKQHLTRAFELREDFNGADEARGVLESLSAPRR